MTSKTIMIGLVAIAFVAGSILTGTMAYASKDKNGKPFEALWDAIAGLQTQIDDVTTSSMNVYSVVDNVGLTNMINQIVQCDSGDIAIASGFGTSANGNTRHNAPVDVNGVEISDGEIPTGWRFISDSTTGTDVSGTLYVMCQDNSPFRGP